MKLWNNQYKLALQDLDFILQIFIFEGRTLAQYLRRIMHFCLIVRLYKNRNHSEDCQLFYNRIHPLFKFHDWLSIQGLSPCVSFKGYLIPGFCQGINVNDIRPCL